MPTYADDTPIMVLSKERIERFWSYVDKTPGLGPDGDCWEWRGARSAGYGRFLCGGKKRRAHRIAKVLERGYPIPAELQIDHLCRNKCCVNPAHLDVVSSRTNTLRGTAPTAHNAAKTHCSKGHLLSGDNVELYSYPERGNPSKRQCRICHNARDAAYRAAQRAAEPKPMSDEAFMRRVAAGERWTSLAHAVGATRVNVVRRAMRLGVYTPRKPGRPSKREQEAQDALDT